MRKKSHISLARYIVNSLDDKELKKHRFSFYIGSVSSLLLFTKDMRSMEPFLM